MTCSPARLEANRRNAALSTGPKTLAGKQQSRKNALKHGMAGAGVVLPPGQDEEADALASQFVAEMKPSGAMGRMLLRRVAVFSTRLDRCERHDAAMTARRVRVAQEARDDARLAEVNAIAANWDNDPAATVRRLMRTPEGIDGLIETWQMIRGELAQPRRFAWGEPHHQRIAHLLGRHAHMHPPTPLDGLSRAVAGDFSGLGDDEGAGLDRRRRAIWARERLAALIDDEIQALRELREMEDDEEEAADRAEAAERALFDPSKEGQLARRYEAAAERGLFRALREFHEAERRAADQLGSAPAPKPTPAPAPARPTAPPMPRPRVATLPTAVARPAATRPPWPASPCRTNPTPGPEAPAIEGAG
ncbi:hypothetical protein TA3x_003158 [Tundrisphaera sp. TA3]|uniref:hypothetical protein n=1 Tax=Tundrisphaera sp. TA3 TaxID=3435775 RepID=UPI003EB81701